MGRRAASCAIAAALAMATMPACGEAQEPAGQQRTESPPDASASARKGVALKRVGNFANPVYVTGAPGFPRLLFVVEQEGTVRVLHGGKRLRRPFLDISGLVGAGGERGLLSIAFPPDYERSGRFYAYFTDNEGDIRIDE